MTYDFQPGDALLIVDAQNDFFPGGALGVPDGDQIIPILNEMIAIAQQKNVPIIASRDWHPPKHSSFHEQGGPWPEHCVQETNGAAFHADVALPESAILINKAFEINKEAYSAFCGHTPDDISLKETLTQLGIQRLWIAGLALDYCVKATVLDGKKHGFEIFVVLNGTRAIDVDQQDAIITEIQAAGAHIV